MLRSTLAWAEDLVIRYPFTIAFCSFSLALALAFRPGLMTAASEARTVTVASVAAAPRAVAFPSMLWTAAPIQTERVFGIPPAAEVTLVGTAPSAEHRTHNAADITINGLPAAEALEQWSDMMTQVAAVTNRPTQAVHDLAR